MFKENAECQNDPEVDGLSVILFMNYVSTGDLLKPERYKLKPDKVVHIAQHITTGCETCLGLMGDYAHAAASIYTENHLDAPTLTDEEFQSIYSWDRSTWRLLLDPFYCQELDEKERTRLEELVVNVFHSLGREPLTYLPPVSPEKQEHLQRLRKKVERVLKLAPPDVSEQADEIIRREQIIKYRQDADKWLNYAMKVTEVFGYKL